MKVRLHQALLLASLALYSCNLSNSSESVEDKALASTSAVQSPPVEVKIQKVKVGGFSLRLATNGTLQARQKVALKLETGGKIIHLAAREGVFIDEGALLLQLDDQKLQFQLKQSEIDLEEAAINKADLLIANGGRAFEDSTVSPQKLRLVNMLSGYNKSLHAIEQAKYELSKAKIYAPFSGLVANVEVTQDQQVNAGETILTLIDPSSFEAVFTLLEEQALKVKKGQPVSIYPLSGTVPISGKVIAINPVVNEQGLVTLYAKTSASTHLLFEGMNVRVMLEQVIPNQIILPKTAVVLRSGKPVVFTYAETEQLAKWNYVSIAYENDTSIAIAEGLNKDAVIIYDGNLNLDHDAAVVVQTE